MYERNRKKQKKKWIIKEIEKKWKWKEKKNMKNKLFEHWIIIKTNINNNLVPLDTTTYMIRSYISNLAGYPNLRSAVYGVEENYLPTSFYDFYVPTEVNKEREKERKRETNKHGEIKQTWMNQTNIN